MWIVIAPILTSLLLLLPAVWWIYWKKPTKPVLKAVSKENVIEVAWSNIAAYLNAQNIRPKFWVLTCSQMDSSSSQALLGNRRVLTYPGILHKCVLSGLEPATQYILNLSYKLMDNRVVPLEEPAVESEIAVTTLAGIRLERDDLTTTKAAEASWSARVENLRTATLAANIAVFGKVGAGKTSILNTIHAALSSNAFESRLPANFGVAWADPKSVTSKVTKLTLDTAHGFKQPCKFILWDIWGFEDSMSYSEHYEWFIDGRLKENFDRDNSLLHQDSNMVNTAPRWEDRMHAAILVIDAQDAVGNGDQHKKLQFFAKTMTTRGIIPVIFLNKVDTLDPVLMSQPKDLYDSPPVVAAVHELSKRIGIPMGYFYPMKTYTSEQTRRVEIEAIVLRALERAVVNAEAMYQNLQNTAG